jgi:ferredoxin-type protein NapF
MTTGANGRGNRLRATGRWLALAASVALVLPWWMIPVPLASFSPLVAACSALATWTVGFIVLLGVPVLVLVLLSPKWFCRYACPVGLLLELQGKLRPKTPLRWLRWPFICRWLALLTLGGACAGYPLFVWLDPLAIFNGFFSAWRTPLTVTSVCAGLALPVALLVDLLLPKVWCARICPLGGLQELLVLAGRRARQLLRHEHPDHNHPARLGRRIFLVTCIGAAAGALTRSVRGQMPPLRPPGALDETRFTGVCIRCGSCTRVCPTRILRPDMGEHGLARLLAPVVKFTEGYCRENCNRCGQACPSGAITRLSLAEKRLRVIGPAAVDLDLCLLANGQECTTCIRACPYEAIVMEETAGGLSAKPVVDLKKCTGCGACELSCPTTPRPAIFVLPKPGVLKPS